MITKRSFIGNRRGSTVFETDIFKLIESLWKRYWQENVKQKHIKQYWSKVSFQVRVFKSLNLIFIIQKESLQNWEIKVERIYYFHSNKSLGLLKLRNFRINYDPNEVVQENRNVRPPKSS